MTHRNARLTVSAILLAALFFAGCGAGSSIEASVSVDAETHHATIEYRSDGDFAITVLFLTYPGGHRVMLAKGNVARGGARLDTGELSPGDYSYTVYWIPQGKQDPDSVSAEVLVEDGEVVSGKFTVE